MKIANFKFALPVVAFVLASAGAVGTNASEKSEAPFVTGYIHTAIPNECKPNPKDCALTGSQACLLADNVTPVWRYNSLGTACDVAMFRP
jgi:hypothetical protein